MNCLATLDIFAGCGGLSEGLQQSGVCTTKWAIEYEEAAGDAFKLNHPESLMFINNCNVILKAIMDKTGDSDDCISTPEAAELAAKLNEEEIKNLPLPGQVDFINGGPPCQGFSGMNRFNQSSWSKVQCEMILAFLSFADYYRPKYFLLENVRNFVSFNKGQTFRLALASLLEMGYQFIWAEFIDKHVYRGDSICHTHRHRWSCFICTFDWKYAVFRFGVWINLSPGSEHLSGQQLLKKLSQSGLSLCMSLLHQS